MILFKRFFQDGAYMIYNHMFVEQRLEGEKQMIKAVPLMEEQIKDMNR